MFPNPQNEFLSEEEAYSLQCGILFHDEITQRNFNNQKEEIDPCKEVSLDDIENDFHALFDHETLNSNDVVISSFGKSFILPLIDNKDSQSLIATSESLVFHDCTVDSESQFFEGRYQLINIACLNNFSDDSSCCDDKFDFIQLPNPNEHIALKNTILSHVNLQPINNEYLIIYNFEEEIKCIVLDESIGILDHKWEFSGLCLRISFGIHGLQNFLISLGQTHWICICFYLLLTFVSKYSQSHPS